MRRKAQFRVTEKRSALTTLIHLDGLLDANVDKIILVVTVDESGGSVSLREIGTVHGVEFGEQRPATGTCGLVGGCMRRATIFVWPVLVSLLIIAVFWLWDSPEAAAVVAILAVLEVSLSFDNAVVNASVLRRMSRFWQNIFLTVGILIAVFGMRLVFPFLVVAVTTHLNAGDVIRLALDDPDRYGQALHDAHPAIAAFGGAFLLMIFLDFLFDRDREIRWLSRVEKTFGKAGFLPVLPAAVLTGAIVVGRAYLLPDDQFRTVVTAGLAGVVVYAVVTFISWYFERRAPIEEGTERVGNRVVVGGRAAAALFVYLEILDASFSFDGVNGAFAISSEILVIAAGLGIGAFFVRGMTIFMVRGGTLSKYIYLDHGAHYAIGALAILLGLTISIDIPEIVTGLVGVIIIGFAFVSSVRHRRGLARSADAVPSVPTQATGTAAEATGTAAQSTAAEAAAPAAPDA
jgi:hypothetical protein